jgi:hypothetical protein
MMPEEFHRPIDRLLSEGINERRRRLKFGIG